MNAVEAAVEFDLYNARCRSDGSGRRTDNLNKELASKFRMTVLDVQDLSLIHISEPTRL